MARKAKTVEAPLDALFNKAPVAQGTCPECGTGLTSFKGKMVCSWSKCPTKAPAEKPSKAKAPKRPKKEKPSKVAAPVVEEPELIEKPTLDAEGKPVVDAGALTTAQRQTREEWLHKVIAEYFQPMFKREGYPLPEKLRVSCGWPGGRGSSKALGQCWSSSASADAHTEIFLSPTLGNSLMACDTLAHELVHAAVGCEAKHGPIFKKAALKIGLEGKMTSAGAGAALMAEMKEWLAEHMPAYPHAELNLASKPKQTTRLLKVYCPDPMCDYAMESEGKGVYSVRMSGKVFHAGAPSCGCCGAKMVCDQAEDEGEEE